MTKVFKFSWITNSIIITVIIVFLSDWIQKVGFINFPLGFRHIFILTIFILNFASYGQKFKLSIYYKLGIISMSLFLLTAYIFSPATILNYTLGIGFTFLFVIMFILGANTKSSVKVILKIFDGILLFFLLTSIFPILQGVITRTSLVWLFGFFRELGAFGAAMNIGTIISISLFIITSKKKYLYYAIFFSFAVLMTILKKTIISNIIVWLAFLIFQANSKIRLKLFFFLLIIFVIGYIAVGDEFIYNINANAIYLENTGVERHVRLGMYYASFNIAKDYFPFGSGMGTFGSLSSIIGGYSKLYFDYGVSSIGANSPEDVAAGHHTLLDTYWPHIFGELGVIGTVLFLYLWFYPFKLALLKIRTTNDPFIKGLSFYITLIVISMTWEGFTLYTPEVPAFTLLHSGLTGLCYFHLQKYKGPIRDA